MTSQFRVLTTPSFERDFRKMSKGNPAVAKALEELLAILAEDPHNRSGKHPIKNSLASSLAKGNGEFAGENIVCVMTSSGRTS